MAVQRTDKKIREELNNLIDKMLSGGRPSRGPLINIESLAATDDDSDQGAGGSGKPGSGEPLMDLSVFGFTSSEEMVLAQQIRQGESKFGVVPDTKDPSKRSQESGLQNRGPQRHPLLSESQRFDGADPKLNALPTDNPEAAKEYRKLANELRPTARPTHTHTATATPTFKPI